MGFGAAAAIALRSIGRRKEGKKEGASVCSVCLKERSYDVNVKPLARVFFGENKLYLLPN